MTERPSLAEVVARAKNSSLTDPSWRVDYREEWAVIACDDLGVTVEKLGRDPKALADSVASWAQQEEDKWPEAGLVYMLIPPDQIADARALEAENAGEPTDDPNERKEK